MATAGVSLAPTGGGSARARRVPVPRLRALPLVQPLRPRRGQGCSGDLLRTGPRGVVPPPGPGWLRGLLPPPGRGLCAGIFRCRKGCLEPALAAAVRASKGAVAVVSDTMLHWAPHVTFHTIGAFPAATMVMVHLHRPDVFPDPFIIPGDSERNR